MADWPKPDRIELLEGDEFENFPTIFGFAVPEYAWNQSTRQVLVRIPIPASASDDDLRGRHIRVTFQPDFLQVKIIPTRNRPNELILVEGKLAQKIRPDECTWQLTDDRSHILLDMTKWMSAATGARTAKDTFWPSLLAAGPFRKDERGVPSAYYNTKDILFMADEYRAQYMHNDD